jgi:sigma-B regulation protein RsbU (phosphoserine phosphatase)
MLPNMDFRIQEVRLDPGDSLLLYTDGITDALSSNKEQFAESRLLEAATCPASSAQERIQNVINSLDGHIGNREQYDDVTLMVVQRKT